MAMDGPDYEAVPLRCSACEARERTAEQFVKDGGSTHGLFVTVNEKEGHG